jgi:uncharacterized membrane protein
MDEAPVTTQDERLKRLKTITMVIYVLQAASFALGVTLLVAIIINYVKKEDVAGTWLASHFRWQMRTFWFGLAWMALGLLTLLLVVGYAILVATGVWFIYRIVKGGLNLLDGKEMYALPATVATAGQ